ncbi:hypothetical protein CsSME_00052566 [Camellia sinensis var. sinensis]
MSRLFTEGTLPRVCEEILLPPTKITSVQILTYAFHSLLITISVPYSFLKALHKKLVMGDILQRKNNTEDTYGDNYWCCDNQIVQAVWTLVPMCGLDDGNSFMALVSDFISRVLFLFLFQCLCYCFIVFHLPGDSGQTHVCRPLYPDNSTEISFCMDTELLISLMRLLKKYLIDDSVKIIDTTSQTIRILHY